MPPTIKSAASTSTQPILAPVEASAPLWELEEPPPDPEPGPEPPPAAPLAVVDLLEPSDLAQDVRTCLERVVRRYQAGEVTE